MATQKEIIAAARKIVAAAEKSGTVKTNPAKRKGTKRPTRPSQITGAAPTKRLVRRRKKNVEPGYFPNPSEVVQAHQLVYYIVVDTAPDEKTAKKRAQEFSDRYNIPVRIVAD